MAEAEVKDPVAATGAHAGTWVEKVRLKVAEDRAAGLYDFSKIQDVGLDMGAKNLTTDKIAKIINRTFETEGGARLKAYVSTCVHCGLCSEACHHYLSNANDPNYSPVGKVKRTIWKMIAKKGRLTPDELKECRIVANTECNICRRCLQFCPFGIDMGYMMALVRRICHLCNVTPLYIQDTAHSHAATMNQMWVKDDEWTDSLQWQEDEARSEFPNLRIPLAKEGSDVYYSVIGPEPKFRTQLIYQAAAIMHVAGVDYTMPAFPGWDNSDMCMFTGDLEMMGRIKKYHYDSALKLKVKKIVMGECGHAFRSVYDMGNRWLGWKMPPIPIVHSIQFFYELVRDGKIKPREKLAEKVSFHDPCNTVRGRGLHEMGRYVTRVFCEELIEMHPNRELNLCCNAGGGVINCGPPWKNKRVLSNSAKAEQMARVADQGVTTIVAPCHNCHGGLEDIIHRYHLPLKLKFLGDILYQYMEKPEA
jgi:Fe-S oxidoreductase